MKRFSKRSFVRHSIACLMLAFIAPLQPQSVIAQVDSVTNAIYKNLDSVEQKVYSETYSNELITQRLARLETTAFGSVKTGPINQRLDSVMVALDSRTPGASAPASSLISSVQATPSDPISSSAPTTLPLQATSFSTTTPSSSTLLAGAEIPKFAQPSQPVEKKLYGSADLSESLQPVHPSLLPGRKFLSASVSEVKSTDTWYRLPRWFAGTWSRSVATYYYPGRQPVTRPSASTMPEGNQIDAEGNVWKRNKVPYTTQNYISSGTEEAVCDRLDVLKLTDDTIVYRDHFIMTLVDHSGTIIQTTQHEQVQRYTARGVEIVGESSARQFDTAGRPTGSYQFECVYQRIAGAPVDNTEESRASFRAYLLANGLERLVPQSSQRPSREPAWQGERNPVEY